jgi:murein L,D-transpeptidase YafK
MAVVSVGTMAFASSPDVPSSRRSRHVIQAMKPDLEAALTAKGVKWGEPVFIRIFKEPGKLEVWLNKNNRFIRFRSYPVCTYGGQGIGPKTRRGDRRAPEGFYTIFPNQMQPYSKYFLAFNLGYPNRYDRIHGRTGSALMVHGRCASIGCYAMTDPSMAQIYTLADAALRHGQPYFQVHIFPFEMTADGLARHCDSRWIGFWKNLKQGHDFFINHENRLPQIAIRQRRYQFYRLSVE